MLVGVFGCLGFDFEIHFLLLHTILVFDSLPAVRYKVRILNPGKISGVNVSESEILYGVVISSTKFFGVLY